MRKVYLVIVAFALLGLNVAASANVLDMGAGLTSLETVKVGDAGNAAYGAYGSVSYDYNIGKYEVTAGQYCEFLNAVAKTDTYGLYNPSMWSQARGCKIQQTGVSGNYSYSVASNYANKPVNYVSFWDACRFANWLNNGQLTGLENSTTTERGAYTLDGYNSTNGSTIQRNTNWKWAVTSENEWYKAAYYKGNGLNSGYWTYATKSDSVDASMANYGSSNITNVGSYSYASAYGTYDQSGNVAEWNETSVDGASRDMRGGHFATSEYWMSCFVQTKNNSPTTDYWGIEGFRVVQAVPEPSSIVALLCSFSGLILLKKRIV